MTVPNTKDVEQMVSAQDQISVRATMDGGEPLVTKVWRQQLDSDRLYYSATSIRCVHC